MKIIHAANFNIGKAGTAYYSIDRKLSSGLVRNGHFVYDFSYRDIARGSNKFGSKNLGTGAMNRQLLETVYNIEPDILLIGHSEIIWNETLHEIKKILPNIVISMWYVDPLFNDKKLVHIYDRLENIDNLYCTTGGELLFKFKREHNNVFYIPNPVDSSIENSKNDEQHDFPIDLLFCGVDKGESERTQTVRYLQEHLHDINFSIYGSLGNPPIYGNNYIKALADSRMGLNISRRNNIFLYSSDRIAQLTGNGILTFTPDTPGMRELYTDNEVVYFSGQHELMEKVKYYKAHDDERIQIARNGRLKSHDKFNSTAVARFITDTSTGIKSEAFYNHNESNNDTNPSNSEDEVLIIRFSSLGDLAVMEPAFRAIRHFHPNSKITFVSSQIGYELYYGSPHFDNFVIDNYPNNKLLSRTYNLYRNLRTRKYSVIYNLQGSSVSHLLTSILHKDKLVNQSSSRLQKLLTIKTKGKLPPEYIAEAGHAVNKVTTYFENNDSLKINLNTNTQANSHFQTLIEKSASDRPVIAIAPGASKKWISKKWGDQRYLELAQKLEHTGFFIIFIGSYLEEQTCQQMTESITHSLNLANKTSVLQLKSLLRNIDLLIANDSGPAHIAAGVGTSTITLFAPTGIHHCVKNFPYHGEHACIETTYDKCTTCYKPSCPQAEKCMSYISVDKVFETAFSMCPVKTN